MYYSKSCTRLFKPLCIISRAYCEPVATETKKPSRLKQLPGKIKNYFLNIFNDYKFVAVEAVKDAKSKPLKTTVLSVLFGGIGMCVIKTPSEVTFRQQLICNANELQMVSDSIRNPHSNEHLQRLIELRNCGRLRYLSLFVCSFIWADNFDPEVDIYEAHCSYVTVGWTELPKKIIDIGFWNRWWFMSKAMENYDINPTEWGEKLPEKLVDFNSLD